MRSKVLSYLLSLSLIFCVGFGSSLTASAAVSPNAQTEWFLFPFNDVSVQSSLVGVFNETQGVYHTTGNLGSGGYISFTDNNSGGVFPSVLNGHRYLLYYNLTCEADIDFNRIILRKEFDDTSSTYALYPLTIGSIVSNTDVYVNDTTTLSGVIDFVSNKTITFSTGSAILFQVDPTSAFNGRIDWAFYLLDVTESSESEVNQIIAAIQDQTSDIQQSIENQYGGDPGSSFPIDDIITQHNEKMGVLSFGSDTLMQVLGLLSPDQTLSSELVFPSMSLTIAGQRNKVQLWPEYRFDLNELKQHWPDFVGLMQSLTTALVWIFVLRYCYRVFEKYFLAGGGS